MGKCIFFVSTFFSCLVSTVCMDHSFFGSPGAPIITNPPASIGAAGDAGLIPGLGRPPGGGHGNPLQYSCLENPVDRGPWQATIRGVTKSRTEQKRLSALCTHTQVFHVCTRFLSAATAEAQALSSAHVASAAMRGKPAHLPGAPCPHL